MSFNIRTQYCCEHEEVSHQQKMGKSIISFDTSIMAEDYNVAILLHLESLSRGIKSLYLRDVIRVLYNWTASIKK